MRPVFTAQEMRGCDEAATSRFGIPSLLLMENAARGVFDYLAGAFAPLEGRAAVILCGKGNNGGDGFALARHLANAGMRVSVLTIAPDDASKGDAAANLGILRRMEADTPALCVSLLTNVQDLSHLLGHETAFVIDALLGTGISSALSDELAAIVGVLGRSRVPVVSIDIPTGIDSETGAMLGDAVHADATVTMGGLKRGLLLGRGKECAGRVSVAVLGSPVELYARESVATWQIEHSDIIARMPRHAFDAHKYQLGKVFVLAGSIGLSGAAAMSSLAALRAGAGIVKLGIPESLNPIMEMKVTEVMTIPCLETPEGSLSIDDMENILGMIESSTVSAIGPGISRHEETQDLVRMLIRMATRPLVVDADALFALASHLDVLRDAGSDIILTPHAGEFSRLIDRTVSDVDAQKVELARSFAKEHAVTLVLKGAPTIIASKDGDVYINPTGNPGMATAGSGDVLTGVVAGLLAQGAPALDAAICGVYLHGMAGDTARENVGEYGLIATDMLVALAETIRDIMRV